MVDSLESGEEETFASDDVVRNLSLKHEETAPALSCHTCGEEIYSEEFVNDEKLYCSEECMERESSVIPMDTTRRRVNIIMHYYLSPTYNVGPEFEPRPCSCLGVIPTPQNLQLL